MPGGLFISDERTADSEHVPETTLEQQARRHAAQILAVVCSEQTEVNELRRNYSPPLQHNLTERNQGGQFQHLNGESGGAG